MVQGVTVAHDRMVLRADLAVNSRWPLPARRRSDGRQVRPLGSRRTNDGCAVNGLSEHGQRHRLHSQRLTDGADSHSPTQTRAELSMSDCYADLATPHFVT